MFMAIFMCVVTLACVSNSVFAFSDKNSNAGFAWVVASCLALAQALRYLA